MLDAFGGLAAEPGNDPSGFGGIYGGAYHPQFNEAGALLKALTGDAGPDSSTLVGGAALRRESLEPVLISVTPKERHFKAWQTIAKSNATAFVDEWTRENDTGGFFEGGAAQGELDDIIAVNSDFAREYDKVKLLASMRKVGVGAEIQAQNGLVSAIAREKINGTKSILRSVNWLTYFGNKTCNEFEFDGLVTILEREGFVTDMGGKPIPTDATPIKAAAARVMGPGSHGELDTYYCSHLVQVDLNNTLDPAFRVNLDSDPKSNIAKGGIVQRIETGFGIVGRNNDPWIQESLAPWIARGDLSPAQAAAANIVPPTSVSGAPSVDAASKFAAAHEGNYYYAIEAGNQRGRSATIRKTTAVTVAAGEKVTLTIVPDLASDSKYYVIYRSRQNGTNADADFREIARIPKVAGAGNTTFEDLNESIPGTSVMILTSNNEEAVCYRRMSPLTLFPLYPASQLVTLWAQYCFMYLRVAKPEHHHLIKNILPAGATWRPFNS